MQTEVLRKISRARAAGRKASRRVAASFARYAVLGLAALSVAPAGFAAQTSAPHDGPNAQDGAEPARLRQQQAPSPQPQAQRAADPIAEAMSAAGKKVEAVPRVNVLPFKQLFEKLGAEYRAGRLDAGGELDITFGADRRQDGSLENLEVRGGAKGDPALIRLAEDFVRSLSASRLFASLDGAPHLRMRFALDRQKLALAVSAALESEQRAQTMASVYGLGIVFERARRKGTDLGLVWDSTKVSASGKVLNVTLEMPRETLGNLLLRQITPN